MQIEIETTHGRVAITAERVDGKWALHRTHLLGGEQSPDLWNVTWLPMGTAIGPGSFDGDDLARGWPRHVAEAVFALVTAEWAHYPRSKPRQKLTAASKRRNNARIKAEVIEVVGKAYAAAVRS